MQRNHTIRRARAQCAHASPHQGPSAPAAGTVERSHPSPTAAPVAAPALAPLVRGGPLRALAVLALLAALALAEAAERQAQAAAQPAGPAGQPEGAQHAADC